LGSEPNFYWGQTLIYAGEHAAGVAVAGITQRDVLQMFADELQRTIDAGGDLREFKRRVMPALAKAGMWGDVEVTKPQDPKDKTPPEKRITKFNPRRLELIFNTNVRQAQAAGQYKRALAAKADFPYLIYLSRDDGNVRPLHKAWHGTVLPVEHPFWETHLPPCGWNCRCRFMAVAEKDIDRMAKRGVPINREPPQGWQDTVEYVRKGVGEIVKVPRGIDPGFDHNPAISRLRGVVPVLSDTRRAAKEMQAMVRAYDLPAPTRISAVAARTPPEVAALAKEEDIINWVLGQFGASIGHPQVFDSPSGLQQVISEELFITRRGNKNTWKILKEGRGDWLPLIVQTLRNPDQVHTLFPRDQGLLPRVRMLRQFLVIEGDQEIAVIVVWDYDKKNLQVNLLIGRSAYITEPGNAAKAQEQVGEFLKGDQLIYDRRTGPIANGLP